MSDEPKREQSVDAEQEHAQRKSAKLEAFQRERQQAETRRAKEKRWKEAWEALEGSLEAWASDCKADSANAVARAVFALAQDLRELGFEEHTRTAVRRLDRLYEKDPTGDAVNLCDLPEVRIICRWVLHVMDGAKVTDIAKRVNKLPPSIDFARRTEPASFEIMHAPQLDRTDGQEVRQESELSVKWKQLGNRFRAVLANNHGDEHPALEIKEICVEGAILASQISPDGKSWLPAPAAMRKYRQPPKADDWKSWGDIWELGLQQIVASYPFPEELPARLEVYTPWKYGNAACDKDWRAGVKRFAEYCDWQMRRSQEAEKQRRFHNALSEKQEAAERCASRLEHLAERLERDWSDVAEDRKARGRFVATYGEEAGKALMDAINSDVLIIDDSSVLQQVKSYADSNPHPRYHQVFLLAVQHWLPHRRPEIGGRAMRYPDDHLETSGPSLAKRYSCPMRAFAEIIRRREQSNVDTGDATPRDCTIVVPETEGTEARAGKVKVLLLAADPTDQTRLRLAEEHREIDEKIRLSDGRDRLELDERLAVRATDLQDALLRAKPDIVHFSGHASSNAICFENANGESEPIGTSELADLFRILKKNIRVVLLNTCYSEAQAVAIAEHIDCTIGMNDEIEDAAAIAFAAAFYRALGYGESLQTAFELGCHELKLLKIPEDHKPQLKTREGVNASELRLVASPSQ